MAWPAIGDLVQTPLGKGTVRECRRNGSTVVLVGGRAVVVGAGDVKPVDPPRLSRRRARLSDAATSGREGEPLAVPAMRPAEVDLHGMTVEQAIERTTTAINDALLENRLQLRVIHGRSGGRIRSAVHGLLRSLSAIQGFRADPFNPGVTIVDL